MDETEVIDSNVVDDDITTIQQEHDSLERYLGKMGLKLAKIDHSDLGNCFYNSVIYGINRFPRPFDIKYNVPVLRKKTAEYITGHPEKFVGLLTTTEELITYCNRISHTRQCINLGIEAKALAHAVQLKIIVIFLCHGNVHTKCYGVLYSDVVRISFNLKASQYSPIISNVEPGRRWGCPNMAPTNPPSNTAFVQNHCKKHFMRLKRGDETVWIPNTESKSKRSKNTDVDNV